jgi:AhpD family alkylhydroperoxidase
MGLVTPLPPSQYGWSARISGFFARRYTGSSIEMTSMGIDAHIPALVRSHTYMEKFFVGKRALPARLFELVAVRAAMEVGCAFCMDIGSYMLTSKYGLTAEDIAALPEHQRSARFSPAEVAALDLAVAMTATPPLLSDELEARVREHYSEVERVELIAMIAWENSRSRMNIAAGLDAQGFSEPGACAVPIHQLV